MVDAGTEQDIIPSMVYGRTFGDLDYSAMYCVVLTEGSSVVSVGLLRVMGGEAQLNCLLLLLQQKAKECSRGIFHLDFKIRFLSYHTSSGLVLSSLFSYIYLFAFFV